jgi:hypothetical protein
MASPVFECVRSHNAGVCLQGASAFVYLPQASMIFWQDNIVDSARPSMSASPCVASACRSLQASECIEAAIHYVAQVRIDHQTEKARLATYWRQETTPHPG